MVYLDLAELDRVFAGRWLWSARTAQRSPGSAARDHLGDPPVPLDRAVRELVEARDGPAPGGADPAARPTCATSATASTR